MQDRERGGRLSTVAKPLAQKQQLMEQLENGPGLSEREETERTLAKIETALSFLASDCTQDANRPFDGEYV